MSNSYETPARVFAPGMGEAVAHRTIARLIDGKRETWEEIAERVAKGNVLLDHRGRYNEEFHPLHHHLRQASILMSGRHLQHGDIDQPTRNLEVFSNCSTAAASFLTFYLLLNGSGVGRCYDDAMMAVDWRRMPLAVPTIDLGHSDVVNGYVQNAISLAQAQHLFAGREQVIYEVPDSREGWAKAIEQIERMAHGDHHQTVLLLDFSKVRCKGSPIKGMQNRPASGPASLMNAIQNVARLRDADMEPWRAAMYADHFLAECVLVGGARRAARMATKSWRDHSVLEFISIKRSGTPGVSHLWSSNNSVTVDEEFWKLALATPEDLRHESFETRRLAKHAKRVLEAVTSHSYHDGTGEPGLINVNKLTAKNEGLEVYDDGMFAGSSRYQIDEASAPLMQELVSNCRAMQYEYIVNPCGEIVLYLLGAYCVIGDCVPYHARDLDDAEDAFRTMTRALIRTNLLDSLYGKEVRRTNRIGVGITGLHEFAWKFFGYGWKDLIDEARSMDFWMTLSRFKRAVDDEAESYAQALGVSVPHTNTTMKPAGTTSKLFGLSEAAHLPAMREYLRYVQFRSDDPLVQDYRDRGYPTKQLQTYGGTTVVGFPTQLEICKLGMGDKLVTAPEATPEEQYQFLRLLEKYWIVGVDEHGVALKSDTGNQISMTMKYDPKVVSYEEFVRTLTAGQPTIRCCSVMPSGDTTQYEYQPETPVSREEYERIVAQIDAAAKEDVGLEHVDCSSGACPISFDDGEIDDDQAPADSLSVSA